MKVVEEIDAERDDLTRIKAFAWVEGEGDRGLAYGRHDLDHVDLLRAHPQAVHAGGAQPQVRVVAVAVQAHHAAGAGGQDLHLARLAVLLDVVRVDEREIDLLLGNSRPWVLIAVLLLPLALTTVQEQRAARRKLEPEGALTGATRELQAGLGAFLAACHENGVKAIVFDPRILPRWDKPFDSKVANEVLPEIIKAHNDHPAVFGYHEIFHALVIVAAAAHYAVIAFAVLPAG